MSINQGMFTSERQDWETPDLLFSMLHNEFRFGFDVCATSKNKKLPDYADVEHVDGLSIDWHRMADACWMNPPYVRDIGKWIRKAYQESQQGCTVVCLVPARTDTAWWHDYCMRGEVRFLRGRVKFKGAKYNAPFPNAVVVFRGSKAA